MGALIHQPEVFYVFDIAVWPEHQGKGIGRRAMQFAEERARARGCTAVSLHAFGSNEGAIGLYRSLGYAVTDVYMKKSVVG